MNFLDQSKQDELEALVILGCPASFLQFFLKTKQLETDVKYVDNCNIDRNQSLLKVEAERPQEGKISDRVFTV